MFNAFTGRRAGGGAAGRSSAGGLQAIILLGSLVMLAAGWLGLLYHLASREAAIRQQAHQDVLNLSIALEKHVERLLVGVDQVMRFIADDFADDPEQFDFQAWLRRSTSLDAFTSQISLYDAAGELLGSRTPLAPNMPRFNVRDRAYFQALAARPDLGLYIDRTLRGRITGRYVIQTARRLTDHDGRFAGVILTSIDPTYLARQFESIDVGRRGSVAMFGLDGYVRARFPQIEGMYESDAMQATGPGLFANLKERSTGTYERASSFDGVPRIFGYRKVGPYPLVVTVGKSLDEVLAPVRAERSRLVASGLVASGLLLAATLVVLRMLLRDRERERALTEANRTLTEQRAAARAAEAEARHANRMLTLAAQIAHVGHWRLTLPGNVLWWSEEVFRIFGLDAQAGHPSLEAAITAYHPDDRAAVARCVAEAVEEGRDYAFSARLARPDGSLRDVVCRGCCEIGADGKVGAVFGTILDVTEMRRSERAVRESEARYRLLADNTRDMIVQLDMDTTRRYVSPASRVLLGYAPEELIGTKPLDMLHPEDRPVVAAVLAELGAGVRRSAVQRQRYRRKDGRYLWVEVSYQIFHDADGRALGCVACTRDIAHSVAAEERLRASEHRFRLLAENTSELIVLGHDDGRRSYISPASERLLGFTPAELGKVRLRDHVHPDDLGLLYATTARLAAEGEAACTYRALSRERGWIRVEGVFRRIPDASGDEPTIVATFRDVTEREAQAAALQQAKEAAERASRAKTDFLAAMSHEIRTPLNAIIGFTDLMAGSGRLDSELQRQAELVRTSGAALLTIVNDILDFSKVEAGAIEFACEPFASRTLIADCMSIVRDSARPKRLRVETVIDPALPAGLCGDEARLRQVLLNLLNNAIKFTPAGSVTLTVRHEGTAPEGERLRFSVCDTGIGIPKAKQANLFQRFSQVDGSVQRTYGGTGLGLAISRQLVERMGGAIGVESEESRGATFWFTLALPAAEIRDGLAPARRAPRPRRTGRLLLVEDVAINQELARTVLEAAGHTITVVGDGAAAVQAVQAAAFDLVLMDVQMPGMDGLTATRLIRRLPGPAGRLPVIAMTANVLPDELRKVREAGMDDHIGKPFAPAALHATLEHWLAGAAAPEPEVAEPGFDRDTYRGVAEMLTPERLTLVLTTLLQDLERSFADPVARSTDRDRLRHEAHALTAAAGFVGFTELAAACRALEACTEAHVARTGPEVFATLLATLRAATAVAARRTQRLRDAEDARAAASGRAVAAVSGNR